MQNPLLVSFETPHQLPPFEIIKSEHYEPAIKSAIESAKSEIEKITRNKEKPTFENTITALEVSGELLSRITPILFNLNSAETSSELQEVAQKVSPLLTTFDSNIKQNKALFDRIDSIFQQRNDLELNEEQLRLLDKTHKSFIRSGASLDRKQQRRFQEIAVELSRLQLTFGEHVLAASNAYELLLKDANQVRGLPDDYLERAQSLARNKGYENGWLITLQAPSYIPFMEYADDRELRKELFMAFSSKAFKGDENDNTELVRKIVSLRQELSELLGYQSYAEYVLDERMASKPQNVLSFLDNLLNQAKGPADREVEELKHYMHNLGATHELEKWDWAYYSEKLRKQKYNLDDELIKP
ncbi:MAG: M3 family metallopeptidase, partial [Cyclobacteriaceae bacterium]